MGDHEPGTWSQRTPAEAIFGPLRGARLRHVSSELLAYGTWKAENARGRVLRPDPRMQARYEPADLEAQISRMPTVTPRTPGDRLALRDVVAGVAICAGAVAYPVETVRREGLVIDDIGDVP